MFYNKFLLPLLFIKNIVSLCSIRAGRLSFKTNLPSFTFNLFIFLLSTESLCSVLGIHIYKLLSASLCLTVAAGWPKLLWFVTESKHLSKPPRDWFPHIKDANNDTAYIEVSQHTIMMKCCLRCGHTDRSFDLKLSVDLN